MQSGPDIESLYRYIENLEASDENAGVWPEQSPLYSCFQIFHRQPTIAYMCWEPHFEAFPGRPDDEVAKLFIAPWWPFDPAWISRWYKSYMKRHPEDEVTFLANNSEELADFRKAGLNTELCHYAALLDEKLFRPIPDTFKEFDAVLNANTGPWKRHELAADIRKWAWITYPAMGNYVRERANFERIRQLPGCHYLPPAKIDPEATVRRLARCRIGLSLSPVDGPTYSSVEYLLCGLPVVYVPSRGRDELFDPALTLQANEDPTEVAAAVYKLIAENHPPERVREITLDRMKPHRIRFFDLINKAFTSSSLQPAFRPESGCKINRMMEFQSVERFWRNEKLYPY